MWLRKWFFQLFLPILARDCIHSNDLSLFSERLHWTGRSNWKLGLQQTGKTGAAQAAVEADRSNNARNWSCSNHAIHKHMPDREGVWWDPAGMVKSWYLPSFLQRSAGCLTCGMNQCLSDRWLGEDDGWPQVCHNFITFSFPILKWKASEVYGRESLLERLCQTEIDRTALWCFTPFTNIETNSLPIVIAQLSLVYNYTARIEAVVGKWLKFIVKLWFIEKEEQFSTEHET